MANHPAAPLAMTAEQRVELETIARSTSRPYREVRHAKALLMAADGVANTEIAERVGVGRGSVLAWRSRFEADGVERIGKVAKGRGRKRSISQETIERVVHDTLHSTPPAGDPLVVSVDGRPCRYVQGDGAEDLVVAGHQAASGAHLQAVERSAVRGEVGGRSRAVS